MQVNCDIVRDLVTLYKDGVANAGSMAAVRAHLAGCPDCRRYYRQYDAVSHAPRIHPRSAGSSVADTGRFNALAVRLKKRRTVSNAAMLGLVGVAAGALLLWLHSAGKNGSSPDDRL